MHSIHARKRHKLRRLLTYLHILQNRTQGIEVRSITKDGIRLSLWDMAGQQEFHAFHDCMFPDTGASIYQTPSMFMFVWSPIRTLSNGRNGSVKTAEEFKESFGYWLKFLASKRRQSNTTLKVMVVFTRADQMEFLPECSLNFNYFTPNTIQRRHWNCWPRLWGGCKEEGWACERCPRMHFLTAPNRCLKAFEDIKAAITLHGHSLVRIERIKFPFQMVNL